MGGKLITAAAVERQQWPGMGDLGLINQVAGATPLVFGDLIFAPGDGFNFHQHPRQDEVLYLLEGSLETWIGQDSATASAGDTLYLPAGTVHACFNVSDHPAKMFVALTPLIESEELGFELVDVSGEAPWNTLRK